MHPILQKIDSELKKHEADKLLSYQFSLECLNEVVGNFEDEKVIDFFEKLKSLVCNFNDESLGAVVKFSVEMSKVARSHPGSKSIDGTRHAAVSATHALAKAYEGDAVQAAAYAAYSSIYGYGGYAVNDPDLFSEVHERQLGKLLHLIKMKNGSPT